jgi:autotransporter-associated beta strand protein
VGQTIRNELYLNGGSITATFANGDWGALHLKSGVTAGDGIAPTTSSIAADTALSGSKTITVNDGSQLNYSGTIHDEVAVSFPGLVSSGITKSGNGTLVLSGANSYSGGTSVDGGTLEISGSGTIGSGSLAVRNSATLNLGITTQTLGGSLNTGGAGNGAVGTINNGTINLNGQNAYLQSGTFTMDLTGGGYSRLWIGGDGNATVELGGNNTSTYADNNSTIIGYSDVTGAAGTVKLLSPTALGPSGQNAQVHSGTLDLNGQADITVSSIMLNNGNLANNDAVTAASYAGTVTFNGTTTPQIGGAGDITLSGSVESGGFTKSGAGKLTLTGNNSYSGDTTVSDGTLLVNGSIGSGAVSVDTGATLGGNGTIGGVVTVASGGTLTLGSSPVLSGVTLMEIDKGATPQNADKLVCSGGSLTFGGTLTVANVGAALTDGWRRLRFV